MIDHIGLTVTNLENSKAFFSQALEPLGIGLLMEVDGWVGYGAEGKPEFWFGQQDLGQRPMHISFGASSRAQVDAFYQAALAAGGQDNGAPGIREHYHPSYYSAFVIGPDGHNIEAVCHEAE
ncbi:VOC family protein [Porticoccus sp. W117]|uniref:VOC family protein n=1 Tax=Porticoccus sp. W117 TaxID=3054777 RepID=UPI00259AE3C1|nr:VOC family protein [Porticoccus sp. W117]MDM3869995.1 VOC family protein [Porticoccus sp. W117]